MKKPEDKGKEAAKEEPEAEAAATPAPEADAKSRSRSRKRASLFGGVFGKKEEAEKKEEKTEAKEESKPEETPAPVEEAPAAETVAESEFDLIDMVYTLLTCFSSFCHRGGQARREEARGEED